MNQTSTLLISCTDRKGIVASIAQVLYGHGANILDSDQHTDLSAGKFFQRIRFDTSEMHTDRKTLEYAIKEIAERFEMKFLLLDSQNIKRIAIFVSEYDHCLFDLLWRHRAGELNCNISIILSNHEKLRSLAESFSIPFMYFPITQDNKLVQEQAELQVLQENKINLVVLARYMQILSGNFINSFDGDIINIHHSFLPAFMGSKPYLRAYERGVKLIGATAHFVTERLDEGPIIEQDVVRSSHRDTVEDLTRKGRDLEKIVLARAVRSYLEDRILVYDNKTVVFD